jgi:hypothetical protein
MAQQIRLEDEKTTANARISHQAVISNASHRNDIWESRVRYLAGQFYTAEEVTMFEESGRVPLVVNKILAPFRTVMGVLSQSSFDAEFVPVGDEDERLAETLSKLAVYEGKRNNDQTEDQETAMIAYATGTAYRMCWVDFSGDKPRVRSKVLNPFAVYFDPDSTDTVTRKDADFVDIDEWVSIREIIQRYPKTRNHIINRDEFERTVDDTYLEFDKLVDRRHEKVDEWNGKVRVTTRFYKVLGQNGREELWNAVWAENLLDTDDFLENRRWDVQPIDPDTHGVMWPVVELVSDDLMGESQGFVEAIKAPAKMASVLYTQLLEAAKHNGGGYLIDPNAFLNEEEYQRAVSLGALANQRYQIKSGMATQAMTPIPQTSVPGVNIQAFQSTDALISEISSAPPALQGVSEGSGTAASLNAQRIEQAATQLTGFFNFFKEYLRQILKLRYSYWRAAYTDEMVFRIANDNGGTEKIIVNEMVPEIGPDGRATGEFTKINDINSAEFDVVIGNGRMATTYRQKQYGVVEALLQNPAIATNPELLPVLVEQMMRLSDAPADLQDKIKQIYNQQQQQQMAVQQMGAEQTPNEGAPQVQIQQGVNPYG